MEFKMNISALKSLPLALAGALLASCSGVEQSGMSQAFYKADYAEAYELSKSYASSASDEDEALALLDSGFVQAAAGYNADSAKSLGKFLNFYGTPRVDSAAYKPSNAEYLAASYSLALSLLSLGDKDGAKAVLDFAQKVSKSAPSDFEVESSKNFSELMKQKSKSLDFTMRDLFAPRNASFIRELSLAYKVDNIFPDSSVRKAFMEKALDLSILPLLEGIIALSELKSVGEIDYAQNKFIEAARKVPSNIFLPRDVQILNEARSKGFVPNMTFVFFESGLGAINAEAEIYSPLYNSAGERIYPNTFKFKILKFSGTFGNDLSILSDGKFYRPLPLADLDSARRLEEVANLPVEIASRVLESIEACGENRPTARPDLRSPTAMPVSVYYASINTPKDKKIYIDGLKVELADAPINIVRVRRSMPNTTCSVQVFSF